ncbi:unnamed protein product [Urochloa decumbens]|uniref:F-box domain-containing protein n=1 Tax=Urochloa decumbens TaxID=240449 RepID=A0ABC8VHD2_9POAL
MPTGSGIDALPDEVLHHILGFLEAHESVRTCVLARRWRHLWKSATGLRVVAGNDEFLGSVGKLCNFMDSLLRLRAGSPLYTCDLRVTSFGQSVSNCLFEDDHSLLCLVSTWFWHAVKCQVRVLRLNAFSTDHFKLAPILPLDKRLVDSRHLTRLELAGIVLNRRLLDFSNCPSLEHLEFRNCCSNSDGDSRLCICAPSLVSLLLDDIWGMIPMLESIPSLVKAVVTTEDCYESCTKEDCNCEFCGNSYSIGDDTGSNGCVLLKGLSGAKDLALVSGPETFIFKKDLRWCPVFILEKLTLELSSKEPRQQRERKGILRPMEGSAAILEHLKIIEVRCDVVDERICKLTLFLCAFHIRLSLN